MTYGTYFDTKLSMFGLASSPIEEGGKSPPEGPWGPEGPPSALQKLEEAGRGAGRAGYSSWCLPYSFNLQKCARPPSLSVKYFKDQSGTVLI